MKWSIDNVEARHAPPARGTTWTFTWNLPNTSQPDTVLDGTYLISAVAYDQYGQAGTGRTVTMVINRYAPDAPKALVGGRNPLWGSGFVEFEWAPNPERDIIGYRVYRMEGVLPAAGDPVVCQTAADGANPTSCWATGQPTSALPIVYYVRAVAPNHLGAGEELSATPTAPEVLSDAEQVVVVPGSNQRARRADQRPRGHDGRRRRPPDADLGHPAPTPTARSATTAIYRDDNTSYTERYGGTGSGSQNAWTDRDRSARIAHATG